MEIRSGQRPSVIISKKPGSNEDFPENSCRRVGAAGTTNTTDRTVGRFMARLLALLDWTLAGRPEQTVSKVST